MQPLMSVCIITFNHERYIRECLQSVVSQVTGFEFEIIVGDDGSADGTVAIIEEFAATHPGRFTVIKHSPNIGGTANMLSVHNAARGEFVAHLDGDDCMLPGKLKSQADFLREHPDHSIVAHDVEIIDADSRLLEMTFGSGAVPESANVEYLIAHGCYFAHSSKAYRRASTRSRHRDRVTVDFFFHVEQALSGLIGYIDRPLGRYRRTMSGLSSIHSEFKDEVLQGHLDAYDLALRHGVRPDVVFPAKLNFRYVNAMGCIRAGRWKTFELLTAASLKELRWASFRQRLVFMMPARIIAIGSGMFDFLARRR